MTRRSDYRRLGWTESRIPTRRMVNDVARRAIRCDTCTRHFSEGEALFRHKDGTIHCWYCGRDRGMKMEYAKVRRFKADPRSRS